MKLTSNKGGNLIISGSELGYDLDYKNGGRTFYREYLRAIFDGDNAFAGKFKGTSQGLFKGIKGAFNNPAYGFYKVTSPDFIQPINGSNLHLMYKNGKGAAVAYKENYGLLYFAFPLESVINLENAHGFISEFLALLSRRRKSENLCFEEISLEIPFLIWN